ncbi:MAG: hypothetical protein L0212_13155, partial [Acidobacteria bacterium]|nr:hypothetical protein [Acidobacteriota bacterium]
MPTMKKASTCLLVCFLGLFFSASVQAQSLDCNNPTRVIPDGRLNGGSIPAGANLWFSFSTNQPRASY